MSEDQLYEVAQKRIDRKNRRWLSLGVDFLLFMLYIGAFTMFTGIPRNVGAFMALAWMGGLVMHVFIVNIWNNRDEAIDGEVAKLRDAIYEKPKRLELNDDGELTDIDDLDENLDELPVKRRSNS